MFVVVELPEAAEADDLFVVLRADGEQSRLQAVVQCHAFADDGGDFSLVQRFVLVLPEMAAHVRIVPERGKCREIVGMEWPEPEAIGFHADFSSPSLTRTPVPIRGCLFRFAVKHSLKPGVQAKENPASRRHLPGSVTAAAYLS